MERTKTYKTRWDLKLIFKNESEKEISASRKKVINANYKFIDKWKDRDDYLKNPKVLAEALDEYEFIQRNFGCSGDEGQYFWLKYQLNQNDPKLKARTNKIKDFALKIANDIQFFMMRVAKIPPGDQKKFLDHPRLQPYRHFLECVFKDAKYLLSEDEEKILNLKGPTSHSNWVNMTSGFLAKEEREVLNERGKKTTTNLSAILGLLSSQQKKVRDTASKALNEVFEKHADVATEELNSILESKKVNDELRGFTRPDAARHLGDDIDSDVVDTLIEAVTKRFDLAQDYYRLKAKLFKVKRLKYHERNVDYGKINQKYSYGESVRLVSKVFDDIDGGFSQTFQRFLAKGQVDVFPKKGRSGGAFCFSALMKNPTYVLLNHTDKLNDVSTIAHEMGHAVHHELTDKGQNALNAGTSLAIAEVASTFFEDFVLEEILRKADDELRLALMMSKLNDDVSGIFRQIACYRFEQSLHQEFRKKGYLSGDDIGKLFQRHMKDYMGPYVEQSPGCENWWVYWSHIRNFFYVYSYASGLLISKSLQNLFKQDPGFIENFKQLLSAGSSNSPKNIFSEVGIDITDKKFWYKGLDEVETLLNDTKKLAAKLAKI